MFFTAVNGYELNNLDNEALDAPVYNPISHNTNLNYNVPQHMNNTEFASLPCERVLMSNNVNNSNNYGVEFSYNNPIYQSAYAQVNPKSNLNFEGTFQADKSRDGKTHFCTFNSVSIFFCFFVFNLPVLLCFYLLFCFMLT